MVNRLSRRHVPRVSSSTSALPKTLNSSSKVNQIGNGMDDTGHEGEACMAFLVFATLAHEHPYLVHVEPRVTLLRLLLSDNDPWTHDA